MSTKEQQILNKLEDIEATLAIILEKRRDPLINAHQSAVSNLREDIRLKEISIGDLKAQVANRDIVIDNQKQEIAAKERDLEVYRGRLGIKGRPEQ